MDSLVEKKVAFNLRPALYANESWVDPVFLQMQDDNLWRYSLHLGDWLCHKVGISGQYDWEMDEPMKRIFLLDAASLQQICLCIGAAQQRSIMVHQIRRERVQAFKDALGTDLIDFVLNQTTHHFDFQPLNWESIDIEPMKIWQACLIQGSKTLWHSLPNEWRAVKQRGLLTFDRGWQIDQPFTSPSDLGWAAKLHAWILDVLIPHRMPSCNWLY
jgi:hypothetical protein